MVRLALSQHTYICMPLAHACSCSPSCPRFFLCLTFTCNYEHQLTRTESPCCVCVMSTLTAWHQRKCDPYAIRKHCPYPHFPSLCRRRPAALYPSAAQDHPNPDGASQAGRPGSSPGQHASSGPSGRATAAGAAAAGAGCSTGGNCSTACCGCATSESGSTWAVTSPTTTSVTAGAAAATSAGEPPSCSPCAKTSGTELQLACKPRILMCVGAVSLHEVVESQDTDIGVWWGRSSTACFVAGSLRGWSFGCGLLGLPSHIPHPIELYDSVQHLLSDGSDHARYDAVHTGREKALVFSPAAPFLAGARE